MPVLDEPSAHHRQPAVVDERDIGAGVAHVEAEQAGESPTIARLGADTGRLRGAGVRSTKLPACGKLAG